MTLKLRLKKTSKKVATKKTVPMPWKREKEKGEIAVSVRWFYTGEFSRALGKHGSGKGRARRNDVKAWAYSVLTRVANDMMGGGSNAEEQD